MGCSGGKAANAGPKVHSAKVSELPAALRGVPKGTFQSTSAGSDEGRRDFARIFFANERKIFVMAPGLQSPKPLQLTAQPSSSHVGDLNNVVLEKATMIFSERLAGALDAAGPQGQAAKPADLDALVGQIIAQMTVNVGIDFAMALGLVPTFLQPIFVVILIGSREKPEVRVATYGFVAEQPQQVVGDRPDTKRTPFVVRLLSPVLSPSVAAGAGGTVMLHYAARCVSASTTGQVVSDDESALREAIGSASWDPLL